MWMKWFIVSSRGIEDIVLIFKRLLFIVVDNWKIDFLIF